MPGKQDFIDLICNIGRKKFRLPPSKRAFLNTTLISRLRDSSPQREYFSRVHHNNYKRYVCDIMLQSLVLSLSLCFKL